MTPEMLVGPLVERDGRFFYDTFTLVEGVRSSFGYRRVEAARYDQRALLAEAEANRRIRLCETVSEFEEAMAAMRRGENGCKDTTD
jgi:hypothetical protein